MRTLSVFWKEWTTPYSLEVIRSGLLFGIFSGLSEGYIVYLIMSAIGLFDTVMIYGK
jgi:hypothetical protein